MPLAKLIIHLVLFSNLPALSVLPPSCTRRSRLHTSTSWLAPCATCHVTLTAIIFYLLVYLAPSLSVIVAGLWNPVCLFLAIEAGLDGYTVLSRPWDNECLDVCR